MYSRKCKARAQASMYWPGMTNDIQEMIAKCPTCANFKPSNKKEPLMPHEVQDWGRYFPFCGRPPLVVVDYFCKYPEVCRLQTSGPFMPDMAFSSQITCHLQALRCGHLQQNGTLKSSLQAQNTQSPMGKASE